jgi:hypothetical protein
MEIGLLWYDGDPKRPLEDKIGRAAERYREKYGRWPNTCYVHPHAVQERSGDELSLAYRSRSPKAMIRVLSAPNILLHHFWVGESNDRAARRGGQRVSVAPGNA